jgi:exopolysaccharide biosynthesis polyprenyl glycosylphosphotransferase
MLRRDRQSRMQIHQMMDAGVFAVSFWLAYELRSIPVVIELFDLNEINPFKEFAWLLLLVIPAAPFVLEAQGFYARPLFCSRRTTLWQLAKACLFMALGLVVVMFLARTRTPIARGVIVWFGIFSLALMFAKEELLRFVLKRKFSRAPNKKRFLLVGTTDEIVRMRNELKMRDEEGIEIPAELNLGEISVDYLVELLHEHSVNGVILSAKHAYFEHVEAAIRACELEGVEAWLVADFFKTQISRISFDDFYGRPVMIFRTAPEASWQSMAKSAVDFFGSLFLLAISSPLFLIVPLLIKLTSPGPVLFRQKRSGLNGRPFTMFKFRTMVTDAEQRKHELDALNEMSGPVFKITKDPRITPIGRILRKFSLDEFPQLYNVLRGDMSLVGPRPLPEYEVKRFDDVAHRRRLSVKPGLTCLWQVSGRNEVKNFEDWVRLDLQYIDNWSIWLDLKILLRTIPVVLLGTGAK